MLYLNTYLKIEYVVLTMINKDEDENGKLFTQTASKLSGASAAESYRYEELIVNPVVLLLTKQRGEIDCGGTEYVIVKYGNFFQFIFSMKWGHVSVCIEPHADPVIASRVR